MLGKLDKLAMHMFFRMEAPKTADDERAAFALRIDEAGLRRRLTPVAEHLRKQGPR